MKLSHLLWSPVKDGETWALTFVRIAGNLIRWLVIFPAIVFAVILAGYGIHQWYDNRPSELTAIEGIAIGMTPDEVTVSKGTPRFRRDPETEEDGQVKIAMAYADIFIIFEGDDENSLIVVRVCDTEPSYRSYNGVNAYTPETIVNDRLGEPDRERIHDDKLGKGLWYDRWNMIVHFEAGSVSAICIGV